MARATNGIRASRHTGPRTSRTGLRIRREGPPAQSPSPASAPPEPPGPSVRLHVRNVNFDADRLANEVHRQNQAGLRDVLAHQAPDDAPEWSVDDLDHRAFRN